MQNHRASTSRISTKGTAWIVILEIMTILIPRGVTNTGIKYAEYVLLVYTGEYRRYFSSTNGWVGRGWGGGEAVFTISNVHVRQFNFNTTVAFILWTSRQKKNTDTNLMFTPVSWRDEGSTNTGLCAVEHCAHDGSTQQKYQANRYRVCAPPAIGAQ